MELRGITTINMRVHRKEFGDTGWEISNTRTNDMSKALTDNDVNAFISTVEETPDRGHPQKDIEYAATVAHAMARLWKEAGQITPWPCFWSV